VTAVPGMRVRRSRPAWPRPCGAGASVGDGPDRGRGPREPQRV